MGVSSLKKRLHQLLLIIGAVLALFVITVGVVRFNYDLNYELEKLLEDQLTDTAMQQQVAFNNELATGRAMLDHIAKALPFFGHDEESILEFLGTLDDEFKFENIMLIEMHGRGMLGDGSHADISDTEHFKRASEGETLTTTPYVSEFTGNTVLAIAAPLMYEGEVAGVIAAEYSLDYLTESLSLTMSEDKGYAMVVDSDGNVLLSTDERYDSFENLTNAEYVSKSTDEIAHDLTYGHLGRIRFTMDSVEKLAEYRPLDTNGWSLVFVATAEEISEGATTISNNVVILSVSIICFMALIALYILRVRRDNQKRIEQLAFYDELTGIPNLVKFKMDTKEIITKHPEKQGIVVMFDVVNFKGINEMFGFELGDKVLKTIAENGNTVTDVTFRHARVGVDEFMFFSSNGLFEDMKTTTSFYETQFKRMLPELSKHQFSFRYGRYVIEPGNTDINDIVNKTVIAHSFAKVEGGSAFWDYDDRFKQKVLRTTEISNKMEDALLNGEFKLFLQPKYRITDSMIVGAEALVRWIEPCGSMVYPNEFIPLFETNGFIVKLDLSMLENVCKTINRWRSEGKTCVPISVNFSRVHLRNPNFVDDIKAITEKYDTPRELIEVELTETTVTENEQELKTLLESLHHAGFSIAIDDFGAGYSSLGMLKNFKVDTLKLDKSFFERHTDERGDIVIDGITKLAQSLYMHTVAEGIEKPEQVELLKKVNCETAQGYFYAKPMTLEDFERLCYSDEQ